MLYTNSTLAAEKKLRGSNGILKFLDFKIISPNPIQPWRLEKNYGIEMEYEAKPRI